MSSVFPEFGMQRLRRYYDVLRSPFSRDFDWRRMLAESKLPEDVQEMITDVVTKTRLFRIEKTYVTEELISHFYEGGQRGKTYLELLAAFGEPEVAATLIRSSKLRNRSMFSKIFYGGLFVLLASVVGYSVLAAMFYMGKPNVSVDYMAQLNDPVSSIDDEDRAWLVYRDVYAKYEYCEGGGNHFLEIFFQNEGHDDHLRLMRPTDGEQWLGAIKKLEDSQELLDAFRAGGVKPKLGLKLYADPNRYSREDRLALFPKSDPDEDFENSFYLNLNGMSVNAESLLVESLISVLLPHIQSFRQNARLLTVDTRWALEQADTERVTRNIETIFGMGRQAAEQPFLVCSLVGIAIHGMGYELVDEVIDQHFDLLSDEELGRIQIAVSKDSIFDFVNLEGEQAFFDDLIQRVYTDDGNGDGRLTPEGVEILMNIGNMWGSQIKRELEFHEILTQKLQHVAAPASLAVLATRKQMTEKADELYEKANLRFTAPIYAENMQDFEDELVGLGVKYFAIDQCFPAIQQVRTAMFRTIANQAGVTAGIAVMRYKREHGQFPESLDDLLGNYITELPIDQLSGDPLKYLRTEDGFQIYSVGLDEDDDGGAPLMVLSDGGSPNTNWSEEIRDQQDWRPHRAAEFPFHRFPSEEDGDWIIWPRYSLED